MFSSPKLTLRAPFDKLSGKPIAFRTCDGSDEPEVHAEPLEAHIPFSSNLNSRAEPSINSNEKLAFPGSLLLLAPFNFTNCIFCFVMIGEKIYF